MSILSKLTDFVGGSLFKEIKDGVMSYFPPDMSEQQKTEAKLNIERMLMEKQAQANELLLKSTAQLDKRIAEQEGTATDLKALPVVGRLVLFARGVQRPVWGFATLWIDNQWFFGNYSFTDKQETALIVINVLVLGFLFGERTVQNLTPMIVQVFGKSKN